MKRHFRVNASRISRIHGASNEDNPKVEVIEDMQARLEDDFDYVIAGIERLVRESQYDAAMDVAQKIADTLDAAIGVIGDDFSDAGAIEE